MTKQSKLHTLIKALRAQYPVIMDYVVTTCSTTGCEHIARDTSPCAFCIEEEIAALTKDVVFADNIHRLTKQTRRAIQRALAKLGDE